MAPTWTVPGLLFTDPRKIYCSFKRLETQAIIVLIGRKPSLNNGTSQIIFAKIRT